MRRRSKILIGAGVVVAGVSIFVLDLLRDGGMFREIEPHFAGSCEKIGGVVGVEDITYDAEGGFAYLSSHDRRAWRQTGSAEGGIYRYRAGSHASPLVLSHDYEGELHPHGIGLWKNPEGADRLFVVNHPNRADGGANMDDSASEVLVFEIGEASLHLVRTVRSEADLSLNDVIPDSADTFYASIDKGAKSRFGRMAETFVRLPLGGIARGNEFNIWKIEGGLTYPNGVALSADGDYLFVAETTGQHLFAYKRDASDGSKLTRAAETDTRTGADNIEIAPDGSLWIGAHPVALAFPGHAKDSAKRSPSQVIRATFDGKGFDVEEIYLNDGDPLSGSSVAAPVGDHILIGAVFDPFFLDCKRTE
ncbi:SMP-30/gluconolactonase/LRE family protein [Kordiimonas gwangyangensis]|uniref:SMP-30/gluconolactonase/LRE family protein n=1 Tax=Kordiimonas gwangyangensis TaxID=288022 RepID=UPI00036D907C|nr:SMP-30/gluconolactonase/LRE family protein [Kordiimonas gwangyangensis]